MNDPYNAGPCPVCGLPAIGTYRHTGAPVYCKNKHEWRRPLSGELQRRIAELEQLEQELAQSIDDTHKAPCTPDGEHMYMPLPNWAAKVYQFGARMEKEHDQAESATKGTPMKTTLADLEAKAAEDPEQLVCYDTQSAWWCLLADNPYRTPPRGPAGHEFPASPNGSVLFQAPLGAFLERAKTKGVESGHYGPHGLDAFMLAYEGNWVNSEGKSICSRNWSHYNAELDRRAKEGASDD